MEVDMEMEARFMQTEPAITANGKMTRDMEKVKTSSPQVPFMKDPT
jgi:hypothetical protein